MESRFDDNHGAIPFVPNRAVPGVWETCQTLARGRKWFKGDSLRLPAKQTWLWEQEGERHGKGMRVSSWLSC